MPLFHLLARTMAALGVQAPGAASSFFRTKFFEGTFTKILNRSEAVSGRLNRFISSKEGAFASLNSSSLSNSLAKVSSSLSYIIRYVVADAYTGVMSLSEEDFRKIVIRLREGDSATDLLDDIDFDPLVEIVDDITFLRDIVAVGVLIGIIVRLNNESRGDGNLLDEYFPEGYEAEFAGAKLTRSGNEIKVRVNGRILGKVDIDNQPVVMAILVLRAWERTDVVSAAADFLGIGDESDKALMSGINLSPSLDRLMNADAADRIFEAIRDAR